jgi:PA14 domain/Malectin domain
LVGSLDRGHRPSLYTISVTGDDGYFLGIGSTKVLDAAGEGVARTTRGRIALVAGQRYPITLGYFQAQGSSSLSMSWESLHQAPQIVPTSQLYPIDSPAPTVTWATPMAITYGMALSGQQLNASAAVPGTFTYSPALGALLPAGSNTLQVLFIPEDARFPEVTITRLLEVKKATPVIYWETPPPFTVGTALNGMQLNVVPSVLGVITYEPAAGTILAGTGTHLLTATVHPTDVANWSEATVYVAAQVTPNSGSWAAVAAVDCGNVSGPAPVVEGLTYALDRTMAANRQQGPIGVTPLAMVYATNRTSGVPFNYVFAGLPAGLYRARIQTTEVYWTAGGKRGFHVGANGLAVTSGIDPYALGGGRFVASEVLTAGFHPDADGTVTLQFITDRDQALVAGIVLERQTGVAPLPVVSATANAWAITMSTPQVTLSGSATDPAGGQLNYRWQALGSNAASVTLATPVASQTTAVFTSAGSYTFSLTAITAQGQSAWAFVTVVVGDAGSSTYTAVAAIDCGNATGPMHVVNGLAYALDTSVTVNRAEGSFGTTPRGLIYSTNRSSATGFFYRFANLVGGRSYRARIQTSEPYWTASGKRLFNVTANGALIATGIDPFALSGTRWAMSEVVTATFRADASGLAILKFEPTRDQALVTAIVLEVMDLAQQPPVVSVAATPLILTLRPTG